MLRTERLFGSLWLVVFQENFLLLATQRVCGCSELVVVLYVETMADTT